VLKARVKIWIYMHMCVCVCVCFIYKIIKHSTHTYIMWTQTFILV